MKYKIIVDKQSRTNPSAEKKEYIIDIEELRSKGDTYDSLVITKDEDYVMRRLKLTEFYVLEKLETPKKEAIPNLNIELFEGDNYIYLVDMVGNKFYAEYLIKNDFNDIYTTKSEMYSAIELTTQNINLSVNQKLQNYSTTEEMNGAINLKVNEINLKLDKKVNNEDYTSAQILLKINNDTSEAKIKADKISLEGKTINLTSENVKITSMNFSVDEYGNMSCNNATFTGSELKYYNESKYLGKQTVINGSDKDGNSYKAIGLCLEQNGDRSSYTLQILPSGEIIPDTVFECYLIDKTRFSGINTTRNKLTIGDFRHGILAHNIFTAYIKPQTDAYGSSTGNELITVQSGLYVRDNVSAINFINRSEERLKNNIQKLADKIKNKLTTKTALDIIKNTDICEFNYYGKTEKTVGLVIGEGYKTPKELIKTIKDSKGKESQGIDLYSMISLAYKAIQELADKISNMEVIN